MWNTQDTSPLSIELDENAYRRLNAAKRRNETYSEVVIRLTSTKLEGLQRRGEKEIVTTDGRRLILSIEQGKCLGAESCVTLAPDVFMLDSSNLGFSRSEHEPLGMKDVPDELVSSADIIRAAMSCPYQAIHVRDAETSEEIVP